MVAVKKVVNWSVVVVYVCRRWAKTLPGFQPPLPTAESNPCFSYVGHSHCIVVIIITSNSNGEKAQNLRCRIFLWVEALFRISLIENAVIKCDRGQFAKRSPAIKASGQKNRPQAEKRPRAKKRPRAILGGQWSHFSTWSLPCITSLCSALFIWCAHLMCTVLCSYRVHIMHSAYALCTVFTWCTHDTQCTFHSTHNTHCPVHMVCKLCTVHSVLGSTHNSSVSSMPSLYLCTGPRYIGTGSITKL